MGYFCQTIDDHPVDKTFLGIPDRLTKPYSYKGSKSTKYSKRWSLKQMRCSKVDQDSRKLSRLQLSPELFPAVTELLRVQAIFCCFKEHLLA